MQPPVDADIIELSDSDSCLPVTHIDRQIIDLTASPVEAYSSTDPGATHWPRGPLTGQQKDKSGRRKRKRKRVLTDGSSASSAMQTREHSVENGEFKSGHGDQESNQPIFLPSIEPSLTNNIEGLFFVDLQPSQLPPIATLPSTYQISQEKLSNTLLLPAHVSIFGTEPAEILAPITTEADEDYIDYLDIEDSNKNAVRYFENSTHETTKPIRVVCKHCGAEGEHPTASCPVLICLTCGARNEHSTRSCPISKTCFTCGMKGHINATCPNRRAARRGALARYNDCDRCGSELHKANECPTLWRLYEYLTEENRNSTLHKRKEKERFSLGQGGEGYIADDEWCYNCAGCGHWGDDCQDLPHREDIPDESSAFSEHSTLSGPFFDSVMNYSSSRRRHRKHPDEELPRDILESWAKVPENVGRKGRMDTSAKLRRKVQEQDIEDDPDDWFGNHKNIRNRGVPQSNGNTTPHSRPPKKLSFGKSIQESKSLRRRSPPSLLQRIGDRHESQLEHSSRDRRPSHKSNRELSGGSRQGDREHDGEPDKRGRRDPGPRYKGGYR